MCNAEDTLKRGGNDVKVTTDDIFCYSVIFAVFPSMYCLLFR